VTHLKLSRRQFVYAGLGTIGLTAVSQRLLAQETKDVALQLSSVAVTLPSPRAIGPKPGSMCC
jgi:hypothetical protein